MATRGVVYVVWGLRKDRRVAEWLERSRASLAQHEPSLPVHVAELEDGATLLDKPRMYELSPFDQTLFLDADTVVMGELGFGFEKAARHDVACCICEAPWARRYPSIRGDVVEYNTGVIYFRRTPRCAELFSRWASLARTIDSSIVFVSSRREFCRMPYNDQASFALAMEQLEFNPFVLPANYNFRPGFMRSHFGPLKVWHDHAAPPASLLERNRHQSATGTVLEFTMAG